MHDRRTAGNVGLGLTWVSVLFLFLASGSVYASGSDTHLTEAEAATHCSQDSNTWMAWISGIGATGWTAWCDRMTGPGATPNMNPPVMGGWKISRAYMGSPQGDKSINEPGFTYHYFEIETPQDCQSAPTYKQIFHTLEPPPMCMPNGCQYDAGTGSCDQLGTCIFNISPTGNLCNPGDTPYPMDEDPDTPPQCALNPDTGALACDCSVDPSQPFCLPDDLPDDDLPNGCTRDDVRHVLICGPNEYPLPGYDPDQTPGDSPIPGDTDGNGVCDVGEDCENSNVQTGLLQKILDSLLGTGITIGTNPEDMFEKKQALWTAEKVKITTNMKQGAEEGEVGSAHAGAGSDAGSSLGSVIMGGTSCPAVDITLPFGGSFTPDVNKIIGPIRGLNAFMIWVWVLYSIYLGVMRMVRS